ncbi:MAG: LuxR C-terminal-related transcriptional regulator [Chloroflexota bacterium]
MLCHNAFGQWIQRRRKLLGYTQKDLAEQLVCAERTVRKIESGALRPSLEMIQRLAQVLQIAPDDYAAMVACARNHPNLLPATLMPYNTTPYVAEPQITIFTANPSTPLFGREKDIEQVRTFVCDTDHQVLTLAGAPGVGKTQLALAVAAEVGGHFADGVVFIPCAAVSHPEELFHLLAQHMGIQNTIPGNLETALIKAFQAKQLLLVLDNFEHLLDATTQLARLLIYAPHIKLLITSRIQTYLNNEQVYIVRPLTIPDPNNDTDWSHWSTYSAIALFMHRATTVEPQFALTEHNAPMVRTLCQRLDGLPLAIELAAQNIRLSLPLLLEQLEQRMGLLTAGVRDGVPHHQNLQTTLDWSYSLLPASTQRLFRCLAIFEGGFAIEGAAAVCDCEEIATEEDTTTTDIMKHLRTLLDHHLIEPTSPNSSTPRFTMLETIRSYVLERLVQHNETEVVRQQHAAYYVSLAEALAPHLAGPNQETHFQMLESEYNNLRIALAWCYRNKEAHQMGIRLALALYQFWDTRKQFHEGYSWCSAFACMHDLSTIQHVHILTYAGYFAKHIGASEQATKLAQASAQLERELCTELGLTHSYPILEQIASMCRREELLSFCIREQVNETHQTEQTLDLQKMVPVNLISYEVGSSPSYVQYLKDLTSREADVLRLMAQGLTNSEIAEELTISSSTVRAHIRTMYRKLHLPSRGAAIRVALEHQLA